MKLSLEKVVALEEGLTQAVVKGMAGCCEALETFWDCGLGNVLQQFFR